MKKSYFFIFFTILATFGYTQSVRPMVTNLFITQTDEMSITLGWDLAPNSKDLITELLIYRTQDNIITRTEIQKLTPMVSLNTDQITYTDTVPEVGQYYYAVIAKTINNSLYDVTIPTQNVSNKAIVLSDSKIEDSKEKEDVPPTRKIDEVTPWRETPLPNIQLFNTKNHAGVVNEKILESTKTLGIQLSKKAMFKPEFLEDDLVSSPTNTDDYRLSQIVKAYYEETPIEMIQKKLFDFLEIPRTQKTTARAHFYLGQTYYYQKEYRQALNSFQKAEKNYYIKSKKWIDESLDKLIMSR